MASKVRHKITNEEFRVVSVGVSQHFTVITLGKGTMTKKLHYEDLYRLYDVPPELSTYIANESFKILGGKR